MEKMKENELLFLSLCNMFYIKEDWGVFVR